MTAQHPAAPETDVNGVVALLDEHLPGDYTHMFFADPGDVDPPVDCRCGHRREWGVSHHQHLAGIIAAATSERVRVVEGERQRWQDKAQEAGEAYANANSRHHEELDRANRLERLADRLAERAVELEDDAREATARAESAEAAHRALRKDIEALADEAKSRKAAYPNHPHWAAWDHYESDLRALLAGAR